MTINKEVIDDTNNVLESVVEQDLNFHTIKELTKKALTNTNTPIKTLTNKEKAYLQVYMKDIIRYINKYAMQGKNKFEYDCENLSPQSFMELARTFKEKYPLFFVLIRFKQILVIDWSDKNEV